MSLLRICTRHVRFIQPRMRYIQSSALVFRVIQSPSVENVSFSGEKESFQLPFNNGTRIFASKRTSEILRSLFVLKLCSYDVVAKHSMLVLGSSGRKRERAHTRETCPFFLVPTTSKRLLRRLVSIRTDKLYVLVLVTNIINIFTYSNREEMFDRNAKAILDCIEKTEEGGFSQMKVTAICSPLLLNVLNKHLGPYEMSVDIPAGLDIQNLAGGFDHKIKFPVLKDSQNAHLQNVLARLDTFAKVCINRNVRLVIDAEQTYLQAAINQLVLALQYKYNKSQPWVYNTYQCYRKDTLNRVNANLKLMDKLSFHFGAKIVRGAYMTQERQRAAEMSYEDPIHDSYEDTNAMYDEVIYTVLQRVRDTPAEVMVATHNEQSVILAVERMKELDITSNGKVAFGQLYGMCDQVSYLLGQKGFSVYKSVPYGPVGEALAYLARRATENRDVIQRTEKERSLLWLELRRRMTLKPLT
ncbi:unnamed protein product [Porites evermanni]|uniref:Proline dehydrogenase n=1 Tax=Porites evermanni TaxID=104178 RepID=A0ABN8RAY6_9CNID|nr:unnamed protein product [Porites evermanni]